MCTSFVDTARNEGTSSFDSYEPPLGTLSLPVCDPLGHGAPDFPSPQSGPEGHTKHSGLPPLPVTRLHSLPSYQTGDSWGERGGKDHALPAVCAGKCAE